MKIFDCEKLRAMWTTHRVIEIARACGISQQDVYRAAREMELPRRSELFSAAESRGYVDPTEDEIKQRAQEVRMSWSEEEEAKRLVGFRPASLEWTPPVVSFSVR